MAERQRHEARDRERPVAPDLRSASTRFKAAQAARAPRAPAVAARHQHERRPAIIGSDSSWPMVSPPSRKPRCGIGLAEQLDDDARDAVADQEDAGEHGPRCPARAAASANQVMHREQHQALERRPRRAGSDAAAAGRRAGTPSPRARRSAGPNSSPLMKLAIRPRNRPIGAAQATASPISRHGALRRRANSTQAASTPSSAAVERHAAVPDRERPPAGCCR